MCKISVLSIIRRHRFELPAETCGQRAIFLRPSPIFRVKRLAARAIQLTIELSAAGHIFPAGSGRMAVHSFTSEKLATTNERTGAGALDAAPAQNNVMGQTEEHRIQLVLLDDHVLFRASLARFLASEPGFEIAGECGTFAEALEVLGTSTVDIVLLDFELGAERASEFISAARQAGYAGHFLLVAGTTNARSAAIALTHGASGIFLKSEAPERLLKALKLVAAGEVWVDPRVTQMLAEHLIDHYPLDDQPPAGALQERERNVLLGILAGLTNKKIGANMGLSESSVKNIVQRLFGRAGVKTRSQLVRVALEGALGPAGPLLSRQSGDASIHSHAEGERTRRTE